MEKFVFSVVIIVSYHTLDECTCSLILALPMNGFINISWDRVPQTLSSLFASSSISASCPPVFILHKAHQGNCHLNFMAGVEDCYNITP
jgi:hypothetical protein